MSPDIARASDRIDLRHLVADDSQEDHEDLLAGLRERPIRIPSRYSYDDLGSTLYEKRIRQPEYYPLKLEEALLPDVAADLKQLSFQTICELGAGSALKVSRLIHAMAASQRPLVYCPIDVNASVLRAAGAELTANFPALSVYALVGTYTQGLAALGELPVPRLFLFLGSTIGNLEDDEIVQLLRLVGQHAHPQDRLLVTADLEKDAGTVVRAYCDAAGIGARMELNVLRHLNRLFGGTFELRNFSYQPVYNEGACRVEARLVSLCDQKVTLPGLDFELYLREGDVVRTDIMRKFPRKALESTFEAAGCEIAKTWCAPRDWYGAFLLGFPGVA